MTQGAFIEYLLFHECDIDREIPNEVYRIKNRNLPKLTATMNYFDSTKKLKAATICQICHSLTIPVPDDVKHIEDVVIYIRNKDLSKDTEASE